MLVLPLFQCESWLVILSAAIDLPIRVKSCLAGGGTRGFVAGHGRFHKWPGGRGKERCRENDDREKAAAPRDE